MTQLVLSILVITHNQRELLKRCLDSVLGQKLNVPFEVIVSDDRSDDGTAEFMAELQDQLTNNQLQITNLTQLVYSRCNSNDCNPTTTSERCGWNKLNAWRHARGKYMVNMDADDFLRSDDIYQLQIDRLEAHPECTMCQQRVWMLHDGDPIEKGKIEFDSPELVDGKIIDANCIFTMGLRDLNPSYMIRRYPGDDMVKLYGKWYDDTVITYHHLQYGPVIFLDRADYVWVQYPKSISHNMAKDDQIIVYGLLPLHHAELIPSMRYEFLRYGLSELIHMFKVAPEKPNLSEQYREFLKQFDGFMYRYYTELKYSLSQIIKYNLIRGYMLMLKRMGLTADIWFRILYFALK